VYASARGIVSCDGQARRFDRFIRSCDGQVDEAAHFLDFFLVDEMQWVEILDFCRNLTRELGSIELSDATDTGSASK
jgi:hypothetical protein